MTMDTLLETVEYKGFSIEIHRDEDPMNPREWDNLGKMVCWHRRYQLGDKHEFSSPQEFSEMYVESKIKDLDSIIRLPLYLYDHSGITMRTSAFTCPWDSGQVGWIYCTKEGALKMYQRKRMTAKLKARIEESLRHEVEAYDKYLTGDYVGYMVKDAEGNDVGDGSCWGFDDAKYAISEAQAVVDAKLKSQGSIIAGSR